MNSRDSMALVLGLGALAVAALVVYALIAPTWDNGKTQALIAGVFGCPTVLGVIGAIFLGLHWRDERQAARREKEVARRQHTINVQSQNAQEFGVNAFVMRQTLDLLGQVAQTQARQAGAQLADLRRDAFQQRAIETPAHDPEPWFVGEWQYDDETAAPVEAASGVRYL